MARAPFSVSERTTKHGVAWDVTIQAIGVPLTYFSRLHRLPNPLQYLDELAENERERGILSLDELSQLLKVQTDDPRVRAGVFLAALCGLRGLKGEDIDRDNHVINIRGNYVSHAEGLKKPKWGRTRSAYCSTNSLLVGCTIRLMEHTGHATSPEL